jgi:hypothetical protein
MTDYKLINEFILGNNDRLLSGILLQPRYKPESQKQQACQKIPKSKQLNSAKPDRAKDVLMDIYNRFDIASTQRASDLGLSASAGDKIYKSLEKEQFVEAIRLNMSGKKGGLTKYHVPTKKGYDDIGKSPVKQSGGTGSKHHFIQRYLRKHLASKGFNELKIEKNIGGKRIDIFGEYNGMKVGIEICITTARTEYINVNKDIDKCDCLVLVCPDKATKDRLKKEIDKRMSLTPNIRICLVHQLLNRPEDILSPSCPDRKV